MKNKIISALVVLAFLAPLAAGAQVTLWKLSGTTLSPVNSTWDIQVDDLTLTGSCTGCGGVSGGTSGMLAAWSGASSLVPTSTPTAASYHATSSTATSTLPNLRVTTAFHFFTQIWYSLADFAEYISDTVGAMFSGNTETGITVTYQDADNTIDVVCDTSNGSTFGCLSSTDWTTFNNKAPTASPTFTGTVAFAIMSGTNFSATNATSTGKMNIPNGADPTVALAGDIAINTTAASTSIRYHDGTAERVVNDLKCSGVTVASSTAAYANTAFGASGSSTIPLKNNIHPITAVYAYCQTDTGTANADFHDGTNHSNNIACSATPVLTTLSSNNTWTMGENFKVDVGRTGSSPNFITPTICYRETAE